MGGSGGVQARRQRRTRRVVAGVVLGRRRRWEADAADRPRHLGGTHQAGHARELRRELAHHRVAHLGLESVSAEDRLGDALGAVCKLDVDGAVVARLDALRALLEVHGDPRGGGRVHEDLLQTPAADAQALELRVIRQGVLACTRDLGAIVPHPATVEVVVSLRTHRREQIGRDVAQHAQAVCVEPHCAASAVRERGGLLVHHDIAALEAAVLVESKRKAQAADAGSCDQHRDGLLFRLLVHGGHESADSPAMQPGRLARAR